LESGRVPPERQGIILEMICARGEADDLRVVFDLIDKPGALAPATRRKVVELLTDAAVTRKVKPSGDLSSLVKLIEGEEAAKDRRLQAAAIRLAAAWKLSEVADTLRAIALSDKANPSLQQAALDGLVAIGGASSRKTIEDLAAGGKSTAARLLAATALARLDSTAGAAAAADLLAKIDARNDIGPLLDALLSRQDGADKLAAALQTKPPPPDAAKIALRYI
jgi:hypothetical protein